MEEQHIYTATGLSLFGAFGLGVWVCKTKRRDPPFIVMIITHLMLSSPSAPRLDHAKFATRQLHTWPFRKQTLSLSLSLSLSKVSQCEVKSVNARWVFFFFFCTYTLNLSFALQDGSMCHEQLLLNSKSPQVNSLHKSQQEIKHFCY